MFSVCAMLQVTIYLPDGEKKALLTESLLKCSPRKAPFGSAGSDLLVVLPNFRRSQNFTVLSRPPVAKQWPSGCKLHKRKSKDTKQCQITYILISLRLLERFIHSYLTELIFFPSSLSRACQVIPPLVRPPIRRSTCMTLPIEVDKKNA